MKTSAREEGTESFSLFQLLTVVASVFCFSNLRCRDKTSIRKFNFGVFTHGVIPGSSHTQALGISSPGIDEARVMGLAILENCNASEVMDARAPARIRSKHYSARAIIRVTRR